MAPQFSWTRIRGESDVEGGRGHGSVEEGEGARRATGIRADAHNKRLGNTAYRIDCHPEQSPNVCTVHRPGRSGVVELSASDKSIRVMRVAKDDVIEEMILEAKLDEQGQCVLVQRDGERILRWHLLRRFLGPLFGFEP